MMLIIGLFIGGLVGFFTCAILSVDNYNRGFKDGKHSK